MYEVNSNLAFVLIDTLYDVYLVTVPLCSYIVWFCNIIYTDYYSCSIDRNKYV